MSWYYCGDSISNAPNNQAFATFGRKLLSICLTQFFVILEVGLYAFFVSKGASEGIFFDLAMQIAWITFLMGTPTFISEICHDTGASGDALTAAKGAKGAWDRFRGR